MKQQRKKRKTFIFRTTFLFRLSVTTTMMNALPLVALAAVCLLVGAQALPSTFTVEDLKKYDGTNVGCVCVCEPGFTDLLFSRVFSHPHTHTHSLTLCCMCRGAPFSWQSKESCTTCQKAEVRFCLRL